jgi:hypothetical protein
MVKFNGNPKEVVDFIDGLIEEYGNITLRELFIILEKERMESAFPE